MKVNLKNPDMLVEWVITTLALKRVEVECFSMNQPDTVHHWSNLNRSSSFSTGTFMFDGFNGNECFDPLRESSLFLSISHCTAKHSWCHTLTCPRCVLVDPEPRGWGTSRCIYTLFENTANALEHSDKDSNFASQCTLCRPLMANGVNNYKATLR